MTDGQYIQKDVEAHIGEYRNALSQAPQLFTKGFHEVQTSYQYIENEVSLLVSSSYNKTYAEIEENGVNNMVIVEIEGEYKIASIVW